MVTAISVIIPVYNVENYLRECLDSVINQSLDNFEIICVNDGSTDKSRDILSEYKNKDKRISILDKENGGLSSARNAGLKAAVGKYVFFLDSDDCIASDDALANLYAKAEKDNLDVLLFDAEVFFENEDVKKSNKNYIEYYIRHKDYPIVRSGKELFSEFQSNWDFKPNVGMQLFSRQFLLTESLWFCENMLHEDEVFSLECLTLARRAGYIKAQYLTRRIRENSIMTTERKANSIYGYYHGVRELIDFAQKNRCYQDETFYTYYKQRIGVLMEQGARLFHNENIENKNKLLMGLAEDERTRFSADMYEWEKVVSLKKKLTAEEEKKAIILDEKEREKSESEKIIQDLYIQLFYEKERGNNLEKELNRNIKAIEKIRESNSFKVGKAVTAAPRKLKKVLKKNTQAPVKQERKIWLIGTPEFGNLGDHMISEVELEILRDHYGDSSIHEISMDEYWEKKQELKELISGKDILIFHGGGNIGNIWPKSEEIRRDAFSVWKKQNKIVMPQSIYFTDDKAGRAELQKTVRAYDVPNLTVACRDAASYRTAVENLPCESIIVPDTVLYHKPLTVDLVRKEGAVLCFRNDKEIRISEKEKEQILSMVRRRYSKISEVDTVGDKRNRSNRRAALSDFISVLRSAELVITDRLHCMIFCALIGTPCIAMDNSYHKLKGGYYWLEVLEYIQFIDKVDELEAWLDHTWKENYKYPAEDFRKFFRPLLQRLK